MSVTRRAIALVLVAAGAGCYEYHTAAPGAVRPDAMVHVVLSSDASSALASAIGPNATSLDGRVLAIDSSRMRLAVTQIARVVGPEEFLQNEPIDVPTRGALAVTVRSVDRLRTALTFGGLLAGVFAAHALTDSPAIFTTKGGQTSGSR